MFSFLATAFLAYTLIPLARRVDLVAKPSNHGIHQQEIPLVGGIAMFCGFMLALLLLPQSLCAMRGVFGGMFILMIIGVLDDFRELSHRIRFIAQIIAALLLIFTSGVILQNLGAIEGGTVALLLPSSFAIPFTMFAIVGVINALNMADGVDGLAGGLTLIALFGLSLASLLADADNWLNILFALIGAVIGFLLFNLRFPGQSQARIFMGNAGSLFLGFTLAWLFIQFSQQGIIYPITALWLFILPLFDTVSLLIRRLFKRRSPFRADRQHLHHGLLQLGYSQGQVTAILLIIASLGAIFGLTGLFLEFSEHLMFGLFMGLFCLYLAGTLYFWRGYRSEHR